MRSSLNLLSLPVLGQAAQPAGLRVRDGLLAGDGQLLKDVVGFDLLYLGLDLLEILGRDAVGAFEVVEKPFSTGRPVQTGRRATGAGWRWP